MYAVKIITKTILKNQDKKNIENEIKVFFTLKHPNIVQFREFHEDDSNYFIVMEYVEGGQLFDRIVEHIEASGAYTENAARSIMQTLLCAVGYLHDLGIAHRDLKPENILVTSHGDDATLKIADFGFAKQTSDPTQTNVFLTMRGTPGYVAPEILLGHGYGRKVDMWSLGVICYILLCGSPPFYDPDKAGLFSKIIRNDYSMEGIYWEEVVTEEAKDFVRMLLNPNPELRYDSRKCLSHPWIANYLPPSGIGSNSSSSHNSFSSLLSLSKDEEYLSLSVKTEGAGGNLVEAVQRLRYYNTERRATDKKVGSSNAVSSIRRTKLSDSFFKSLSNRDLTEDVAMSSIGPLSTDSGHGRKLSGKSRRLADTLINRGPQIGVFTDGNRSDDSFGSLPTSEFSTSAS
jgi:calcium/calmodulin-dependent protein kinase I